MVSSICGKLSVNCSYVSYSRFSLVIFFTHVRACSVMPESLRPCGLKPARLLCSWDFPGKSGLLFPALGHHPNPGIEPVSLISPALVHSLPTVPPGKPHFVHSSWYMSIPISQFILNAFPAHLGIQMFVLYISASISTLKIGSSVPFF